MFLEQIPAEYTFLFVLYGGSAFTALIACLYLCLRKGNAIAPDTTPPMSLRRWAAAFFGFAFLSHVWWLLFFVFSNDLYSVFLLVVAVIDYVALLISIGGSLFAMLQDRKRQVWPLAVAMIPYAALLTLNVVFPKDFFLHLAIVYLMFVFLLFSIYMVFAVRQYKHWLRDNYADLEHKEVWISHVLILIVLLLLTFDEIDGVSLTISYIVRIIEFPLFFFLVWRVETLPRLEAVPVESQPVESQPMEQAVAEKLYLQHDLSLLQLAQAVGTNRFYLSQYFSRQGITYNAYINNLRINHFMRLYHEAVAAQRPVAAQQLAHESGYRSYSTFSLAFKQRTGQSVTAWMRHPQDA